MTNEQIILNEAAKLDPATLHAIATAHHTPEQIAAIAAKATTTDDDGNEKPASVADVEAVLAADELHTIAKWNSLNKRIRTGEKSLITCYLWKYTTKPSKEQREAAEAEGKEAAPAPHFYPTKSYLFSCLQVEDAKAAPAARFGSVAEIMAYNKKLAAERKAAKEAAAKAAAEQPASKPTPEIISASVTDKKPGGWKKCSFYAICTTPQNPTSHAEKRDGYTDGVFNYYALHLGKATIWYAVHPAYGVSIGPGKNSRTAAKAAAFELLESVAKMEKTPSERLKNCAAMVAAAQNA
nr:MAG TPA: hypothetical protein [Caudoviricetes sp.]